LHQLFLEKKGDEVKQFYDLQITLYAGMRRIPSLLDLRLWRCALTFTASQSTTRIV
jgi:hypothetical protein